MFCLDCRLCLSPNPLSVGFEKTWTPGRKNDPRQGIQEARRQNVEKSKLVSVFNSLKEEHRFILSTALRRLAQISMTLPGF